MGPYTLMRLRKRGMPIARQNTSHFGECLYMNENGGVPLPSIRLKSVGPYTLGKNVRARPAQARSEL